MFKCTSVQPEKKVSATVTISDSQFWRAEMREIFRKLTGNVPSSPLKVVERKLFISIGILFLRESKVEFFMMWVLLKLILHPLTLCPRPREAGMKCRLVVNWTSEVVNTTSINGKMIYNYFNNGKYRNKQSSRLHNQGAVAWISSAIQNVWHLTQKQNILNDCFQTVWGFYLKQKRWLNPFKSSKFHS